MNDNDWNDALKIAIELMVKKVRDELGKDTDKMTIIDFINEQKIPQTSQGDKARFFEDLKSCLTNFRDDWE